MNERQSSEIRIYSVDSFEAKVKELNRKAERAAVAPISYTIGSEWIKEKQWVRVDGDEVEVVFFYKLAQIEWSEIIYPEGWKLEGVIDHQEGIVKSVPGSVVELRRWEERGPVCDHCHTSRDRKETFVLSNEKGELRQVGRSCIHLFLGVAVERALAGIGLSIGAGGLEEEQRGQRQPFGYGLVTYLASAATVIRESGWRSRSAVANEGGRATADQAWENLENAERQAKDKYGAKLWTDPTEADIETGKAVAVWLAGLNERRGLNDYLSNLAKIGQNDFVTSKSAGFAASAVVAWGKEREEEIKRAAKRSEQSAGGANEYVGHVGDKVKNVPLTLVKSFGFDNEWGVSYIHRFVDEYGRVFIWKTATGLDLGQYVVSASIKAHEEYGRTGEKQTVLTRAKTIKVEGVVKA